MRYLWRKKNSIMTGLLCFAAMVILFATSALEAKAYIQTQGTVISESAKVRKEPNTSSSVIASLVQGDEVTINNEETDSAGVVWYKVFVDANTLGYVRGDLIQKAGSTVTTQNTTTDTNQTTNTNEAENTTEQPTATGTEVGTNTTVTPIQSQGASVVSDNVRVRSEASTNSNIVTMVRQSTAVTVNGQAEGSDGKIWYRASFVADGSEVTGFIRADFLQLTEEVVIIDESASAEVPGDVVEEPMEEEPLVEEPVSNDYELVYEADANGINDWYLYNNVEGVKNKLSEILNAADSNNESLDNADEQLKKQKLIIIVLAIVLVFLALAVTLLLFKIRDMYYDDFDAYDEEPEQEVLPEKKPRTVKPVQAERPVARPAGNGQRPANGGQRPQGNGSQRPANGGQRPQGNGSQRPANGGQRPQGNGSQRPANGGQRPQGNGSQRPANGGQRPQGNGSRPENANPKPQNQSVQNPAKERQVQDPKWKARNFMADDDDFEFEFLNWDGEER